MPPEPADISPDTMVLAIDPGSAKSGLALVRSDGGIVQREIVYAASQHFQQRVQALAAQAAVLVLGNGTHHREYAELLRQWVLDKPLVLVDEAHSTEAARTLYFTLNPPQGLWKLVPLGLQTPPKPVDDLAAVVLARRYLTQLAEKMKTTAKATDKNK